MPRSGTRRAQAPGGGGCVNCHGLYRRITRSDGATTTHEYCNERWKPIEEREGASSDPVRQWVWGQRPGHRDPPSRGPGVEMDGAEGAARRVSKRAERANQPVLRDRDCLPAGRDDLRCGFAIPSPRIAAKQATGDGALDERLYCLMDYFDPTAVIDTGGTVLERYDFSAFGIRRIMAADFSARSSSNYAWRFGFKGQLLDEETGYYNYGLRYYVPRLGSWIKRDPIGENGGLHLYIFTDNNAINLGEYHGLEWVTSWEPVRHGFFRHGRGVGKRPVKKWVPDQPDDPPTKPDQPSTPDRTDQRDSRPDPRDPRPDPEVPTSQPKPLAETDSSMSDSGAPGLDPWGPTKDAMKKAARIMAENKARREAEKRGMGMMMGKGVGRMGGKMFGPLSELPGVGAAAAALARLSEYNNCLDRNEGKHSCCLDEWDALA